LPSDNALNIGERAGLVLRRGVPFLLHTGDLDRAGEALRDLDAPILAKPSGADDVVSRLFGLNGQLQPA